MTDSYQHQDKDGIHALDDNLQARRWGGFAPTRGFPLSIDTGNLGAADTLLLGDGAALVNGTHYPLAQQSVGLSTAPDGDVDRWDLIGLDATGSVVIDEGEPEIPDPVGVRFTARKRPSPPDLYSSDIATETPLWLVYVEGGSESIDSTHLVDRRSTVDFVARQAHAAGVAVKTYIQSGETATVKGGHSMVVVGPYDVEGELTVEGRLRVID